MMQQAVGLRLPDELQQADGLEAGKAVQAVS